jgi:hypothetical protein
MQTVLGPVADAAARATGFVQRQRRVSGANFVQTLVFGWLAQPQTSLTTLCQAGTAVDLTISAQGLTKRFTPQAAACLERVLGAAVQAVIAADPVAVPLLQRFPGGVWVQDSTVIGLPVALRARWPGCGNGDGPSAALKLQVRHDLLRGTLDGPLLQAGRAQDRTSPHREAPLPPEALRLADLGFFSLADLRARDAAGSFWLTRVQAGTKVVTTDGQAWDLSALLAAQATTTVDLPIALGTGEQVPCRLLAARVPQEVADQRRRRLTADAQREGKPVSRERLALCAWTVLVTNVPPDRLTVPEALVLARARWQIELLFKLWKSHNQVDAWRSRNPWRILCEVYAKLIAVIIQHWLLVVGCWQYPDRSLRKAAHIVPQYALSLALALPSRRRLVAGLAALGRAMRHGSRINTSRRRPHLHQLLLALSAVEADTAPPPSSHPAQQAA